MTNTEDSSSTRKQILILLKTKGPLSASEITTHINITNMAIRRHLHTLERDGLIESRTVHQSMGRPTAVFKLTEAADSLFPKNYHTLTLDLLTELMLEAGPEMVDTLFKRRKDSMYKQYELSIHGTNLEDKVAQLAAVQNDHGYMANWERTDNETEEYLLTEHNCPITQIANQYEQACKCEIELFEALLNAEVTRTDCLAKGANKCVYKIRPKQKDRPTS